MASQQCASLGLIIALLASVGICFALGSRYWQISSQQASQQVNQGISSYEGLWVRCTSYTKGQFQCDNFDQSYLGLPASLNTQRAFMVISGIFVIGGLIASILGMQCVNALDDEQAKLYSARAGGALILAAGVLTMISVSWYAAGVVQEFYQDQVTGNAFTYQFGVALYIGWISAGAAMIAGFLILCCTPGPEVDEYSYNPPKKQAYNQRSAEYV